MRALAGLALLALGFALAAPAFAEDGSEQQQRCVSSCLYHHAKGPSDPGYERCVARYCAHIGEDEDEAQEKKK